MGRRAQEFDERIDLLPVPLRFGATQLILDPEVEQGSPEQLHAREIFLGLERCQRLELCQGLVGSPGLGVGRRQRDAGLVRVWFGGEHAPTRLEQLVRLPQRLVADRHGEIDRMGELRGTGDTRAELLELLQGWVPLPAFHEKASIRPPHDRVVVPLERSHRFDMGDRLLAAFEIEEEIDEPAEDDRIVGERLHPFAKDLERQVRIRHSLRQIGMPDNDAGIVGVGGQPLHDHLLRPREVVGPHRDLELGEEHLWGFGRQLGRPRNFDPRRREIVVEEAPRRHGKP